MRTVRETEGGAALIAAIVDALKPFGALPPDEIDKRIRKTLDGSRWVLARMDRSAIRENNAHIARLRATIRRFVDQISKAPAPVRVSAFSGRPRPYPWGILTGLEEMDQRLSAAKVSAKRDPIKQFCAEMARDFFLFYSKKPPSSSEDSPFRAVASLVYEYFTGKAEQDLERPCEAALRKIRDHPISTNSRKKSSSLS